MSNLRFSDKRKTNLIKREAPPSPRASLLHPLARASFISSHKSRGPPPLEQWIDRFKLQSHRHITNLREMRKVCIFQVENCNLNLN